MNHLNTSWIKTYRYSIAGLLIGILLFIVTLAFDLDLYEELTYFLVFREGSEIDELVIPLFVFLFFSGINLISISRKKHLQNQKEEVYRTMVNASNHVLKTYLNQMMLMKLEAEETPGFDKEVLLLFDQIVDSANKQLEALGNLENISVEAIWESLHENGIHFDTKL